MSRLQGGVAAPLFSEEKSHDCPQLPLTRRTKGTDDKSEKVELAEPNTDQSPAFRAHGLSWQRFHRISYEPSVTTEGTGEFEAMSLFTIHSGRFYNRCPIRIQLPTFYQAPVNISRVSPARCRGRESQRYHSSSESGDTGKELLRE